MLNYHFKARDGFIAAVVLTVLSMQPAGLLVIGYAAYRWYKSNKLN